MEIKLPLRGSSIKVGPELATVILGSGAAVRDILTRGSPSLESLGVMQIAPIIAGTKKTIDESLATHRSEDQKIDEEGYKKINETLGVYELSFAIPYALVWAGYGIYKGGESAYNLFFG